MSVALGSSSIRTASAAAASSSRSGLNTANGSLRAFSASASVGAKPRKQRNANDPMALRKMGKFNYDDVPTLGHLILQRKRETLQLLRTIEFEIPKLAGMRQAYKPPTTAQCVQYRFQHYQGEKHPASRKVVLNVSVDALANSGAVKDDKSRHKLLLLVGSRFHPTATPATSHEQPKGDIKISCELFPNERQNMKWCSDTLDALIKEANVRTPEVDALPLDPRASLIRQDKKRHYLRADRPTLKHFPKHWL